MMRGRLLKCSAEQVRRATEPEYMGTEVLKELTRDMVDSIERQGHRGFVDVATEGLPEEQPAPVAGEEEELVQPAQPPSTLPDAGSPPPAGLPDLASRSSSRRPSSEISVAQPESEPP
eukprot:14084575-Alexandrium_andersonii.AAC.1